MRGKDDHGDAGPDVPRRTSPASSPKVWVGIVFAVFFLVFVLLNRTPVEVNYIFFTRNSHLIWVMLICGVLGFVVGWLWGRPGRVRAKRREKD